MTSPASIQAVYANALLALATERGKREAVVADCRMVLATLEASPELIDAAGGSALGRTRGKELLAACFTGKVATEMVDFLRLLVDRGRLDKVVLILKEAISQAERSAGRVQVVATSAVDLNPAGRAKLEASLKRRYGPGVEIAYQRDPALIGGLRLRVGEETLIDSSMRRHLDQMRQRILVAPWSGAWEGAGTSVHS